MSGTAGGAHDECYACPVGSFFAGVQSAQPDALEHLLNAAYELLEVARGAIEAAETAIDQQRSALAARDDAAPRASGPARRARVRHIDIA